MKAIGIFLGAIALVCVLVVGGFAFRMFTLPFHAASNIVDTEHGVIDKTINADNAIYNYEWFKQQAEDIKANETKITIAQKAASDFDTAAGKRSDWTFEDKTESARLHAVAQGLLSQEQNLIADYNARSKMANRNIFKDGLFPDSFEIGSNILRGL